MENSFSNSFVKRIVATTITTTMRNSKKYFFVSLLFALLLLFVNVPLHAQWSNEEHGLEFKGFIDTVQGVRVQDKADFLSSRTRLRAETQFYYSDFFALASVDAIYNAVVENESGLHLKEAFMSYENNFFDIRLGRQIIIWGKASGFQVTDLISPKDYSDFLARDFDDMRLPVDGMKARFLAGITTFEFIWLPKFTPAVMPYKQEGVSSKWSSNPWAITLPSSVTSSGTTLPVTLEDAQEPDFRLKNSDAAFKFSLSSSHVDMAISYLYVWDDFSVMQLIPKTSGLSLERSYKCQHVLGVEFSIPANIVVVRTESAFYFNKYFTEQNLGEPIKKHATANLLGLDFLPGKNWTISLQAYNMAIFNYDENMQTPKTDTYITLSVQKKFLRETLTLSTMFFFGAENLNLYNRTYVEYAVADPFHIVFGFDVFYAPSNPKAKRAGMFSAYKDNNQVFFKAKYSFSKEI